MFDNRRLIKAMKCPEVQWELEKSAFCVITVEWEMLNSKLLVYCAYNFINICKYINKEAERKMRCKYGLLG